MATPSETSPLLRAPDARSQDFDDVNSKNVVEFDPNGDSEDPKQWPNSYKYSAVFLLALMAFTVYAYT